MCNSASTWQLISYLYNGYQFYWRSYLNSFTFSFLRTKLHLCLVPNWQHTQILFLPLQIVDPHGGSSRWQFESIFGSYSQDRLKWNANSRGKIDATSAVKRTMYQNVMVKKELRYNPHLWSFGSDRKNDTMNTISRNEFFRRVARLSHRNRVRSAYISSE